MAALLELRLNQVKTLSFQQLQQLEVAGVAGNRQPQATVDQVAGVAGSIQHLAQAQVDKEIAEGLATKWVPLMAEVAEVARVLLEAPVFP